MDGKSIGASSTKHKWMQELIRLKNEVTELRKKADEREKADTHDSKPQSEEQPPTHHDKVLMGQMQEQMTMMKMQYEDL